VPEFRTIRQAKDFLAGKIADEAVRKGTPLTQVERKMLYFSETGWTLPDMAQVSEEFDRDYDQDEYERKIAGFVSILQSRDEGLSETEKEAWYQAVQKISDEDHYLLVLIGAAKEPREGHSLWMRRLSPWLPSPYRSGPRPPGDLGRLILVGLAIAALLVVALVVLSMFHADFDGKSAQ